MEHLISISDNKLWGESGGQLEYVSQRIEMKKRSDNSWHNVLIIRFTDHDHWKGNGESANLIEGVYYELEFPIYEG